LPRVRGTPLDPFGHASGRLSGCSLGVYRALVGRALCAFTP